MDYAIRVINRIKLSLVPHANNPLVKILVGLYYAYFQNFLSALLPGLDCTAMLALTYDCQCRCVHCSAAGYRDAGKRYLSPEEVTDTIIKLKTLGVSQVYFFGGEPLLSRELPDYIRLAKSLGMLTQLDTNGLLLDEPMIRRLKIAGIDFIGISLDSDKAGEHDRLRGVPGSYERAVAAVKACRKSSVKCFISTYATKEKLRDGTMRELVRLSKGLGARLRILSPIMSGRWFNHNEIILDKEDIGGLKNLLENDAVFWETYAVDNPRAHFFCHAVKKMQFYISAYGDIQPCCFMPLRFGNLREEPLPGIVRRMWTSSLFGRRSNFPDCPLNDKKFRERFCAAADERGLPVTAKGAGGV